MNQLQKLQKKGNVCIQKYSNLSNDLNFCIVDTIEMRKLFDDSCNKIHYAGSCQRVGRCLRLAIVKNNE